MLSFLYTFVLYMVIQFFHPKRYTGTVQKEHKGLKEAVSQDFLLNFFA